MTLLKNMRRLKPKEIWQEGDWLKVDRGIYAILKYRNTDTIGAIIGEPVGKEIGLRLRENHYG
jgi:hypothetical protein